MRIGAVERFSVVEPPLSPPILAIRAPGARSGAHSHHAMHILVCVEEELRVRAGEGGRWLSAPGVVTAPNVTHSIDAAGREILLVFLDPESEAGAALRAIQSGPYLQWLKLQRAAAAISAGVPLGVAAQVAGFTDSAHMSRTFRRTLGVAPSQLRPPGLRVRFEIVRAARRVMVAATARRGRARS